MPTTSAADPASSCTSNSSELIGNCSLLTRAGRATSFDRAEFTVHAGRALRTTRSGWLPSSSSCSRARRAGRWMMRSAGPAHRWRLLSVRGRQVTAIQALRPTFAFGVLADRVVGRDRSPGLWQVMSAIETLPEPRSCTRMTSAQPLRRQVLACGGVINDWPASSSKAMASVNPRPCAHLTAQGYRRRASTVTRAERLRRYPIKSTSRR